MLEQDSGESIIDAANRCVRESRGRVDVALFLLNRLHLEPRRQWAAVRAAAKYGREHPRT